MIWWVLLVVAVIFAYVKLYRPHQYWKERKVLHVKPKPIIGTVGKFAFRMQNAADWSEGLYKQYDARYVGTYLFLQPTLLIKDINLIKQIFIKDFDHFIERNSLISEEIEPFLGKGLFFLNGQRWRDMRATLSPAFTSSKMRSMLELITECAEQFTTHFAKSADPDIVNSFEMKEITTRYATDVIASCAFGMKCNSLEERNNEFYLMGKEAIAFTGIRAIKLLFFMMNKRLMEFLGIKLFGDEIGNFFRSLVRSVITTREKEGIIRPDMIHLLMEAKKGRLKHEELAKTDAGFATVEESHIGTDSKREKTELTEEDIVAQAVLFFAAGFETSSSLLCFTAYELALNEDIQRRLQEEIDTAMEDNNGKISYETILKMKYLDMVISESLRKWPPVVGIDRKCVKPYTIEPLNPGENPVHIEQSRLVWIAIYAMHRDPKYFPDPERFDPERFSDENKHNIIPFSYLPFGVGPRNCIGSRFALLEAKAFFVHLLAKFDLVVVEKTQIPLQLDNSSFAMTSKNGFWVGLKLREK